MQDGWAGGVPRVDDEGGGFEQIGSGESHCDNIPEGEAFVNGRKAGQQFRGATEESRRRAEAPAVDAVCGLAMVVLQMHVAASELDEGFVEDMALALGIEPDVFEHVVGLVIFLHIEEAEVFEVAGVVSALVSLPRHARADGTGGAPDAGAASSAA